MSNRFTYAHDCGHYFLSPHHGGELFMPHVLLNDDNSLSFAPEPVDSLVQRLAQRIVAVGRHDHTASMKEHGRTVTALLNAVVGLLQKAKD
jgi:hypothetical protein